MRRQSPSALKAGFELEGTIRAVLLVENLGAFCDLAALDGWLFAHVAGWDTQSVTRLLELLQHIPVIHFGDLDPNGVRIFLHFRSVRSDLRWFVPSFWEELLKARDLSMSWPEDLDLHHAPELLRRVAQRGVWLEQEAIVVDPRTLAALEAVLTAS